MTVIISGTDGVSDVDGSAGTPAIRGTDANTGIFFGADQVGVATNGVERVEFGNSETVFNDGGANVDFRVEGDTNANLLFVDASADCVGIGTSTPSPTLLAVRKGSGGTAAGESIISATLGDDNSQSSALLTVRNAGNRGNRGNANGSPLVRFEFNNAPGVLLDKDGNFLVGKTTTAGTTQGGYISSSGQYVVAQPTATGAVFFQNTSDGATVGTITINASTTTYATSSDYRLKHDIAPMTGALARVALLKPVTYKWNINDSADEGFIAHELAEVCPSAVSGEKDAVETYTDEDGVEQTRIKPQGIDTSFLVATLTAAIQELKAINDAQASRIETLETKVAALEAQ